MNVPLLIFGLSVLMAMSLWDAFRRMRSGKPALLFRSEPLFFTGAFIHFLFVDLAIVAPDQPAKRILALIGLACGIGLGVPAALAALHGWPAFAIPPSRRKPPRNPDTPTTGWRSWFRKA